MLSLEHKVERGILVLCNWAVFAPIGLGFVLEGGARDSFPFGLIGIGAIFSGLAGHVVINAIYRQPFTVGESALGLGVFATMVLVFIASWFASLLPPAGFAIGLTLLGGLVAGFLIYAVTRYGLAGAFRRFDVIPGTRSDRGE